MAEFKLVISDPKTGKSIQRELKDAPADALKGKKIKDTFKGELIDLPGYEFEVTGGSDSAGFPMRWDVGGATRKQITAVKGTGVHNKLRKPNPKKKGWRTIDGMRLKKTVAGNTIHEKTAQVNLKILKKGKENLFGGDEAAAQTPAPDKGGNNMKEENVKDSPEDVKEEVETVPEKTEEVIEKVEEVSLKGEEEIAVKDPSEDKTEETKEEAPAEETEEKDEESEKLMEDVDKLDEEISKDEEELEKEDKEIEEIEGELKEDAPEKKEE